MKPKPQNKILARTPPDGFIGREAEIERLLAFSFGAEPSILSILAAPSSGASELLRQTYDRLFSTQTKALPFYFEIKKSDRNLRAVAARFAHEFLMQAVAFHRQDASILRLAPSPEELARRAPAADAAWMDDAVEAFGRAHELKGRAFVRNCLGVPLRASARRVRTVLIVDGTHELQGFEDGMSFLEDLADISEAANLIVAGHRRFLYGKFRSEMLALENLNSAQAGLLCQRLSKNHDVAINDQTRDLIAVQVDGEPFAITALLEAAAAKGLDLDTFERVERVYTDEIMGGQIGRKIANSFADAVPEKEKLDAFIVGISDGGPVAYSILQYRSEVDDAAISRLNSLELVNSDGFALSLNSARNLVADYVRSFARLAHGGARALVVGELLSANVRRAPDLMATAYRKDSRLDLKGLLLAFRGKGVATALLDYRKFKIDLKGLDDAEIVEKVSDTEDRTRLPRISYCADAAFFSWEFGELASEVNAVIGLGIDGDMRDVAIIAAEIDSKLEVTRDVTDVWHGRLTTAAENCGFENYRIWLVAKEGFDEAASKVLADQDAIGSSRKQALLLATSLDVPVAKKKPVEEYELVVPMSDDSEIVSSRVVDEIAQKHGISPKAINQIKTALVEACINAAEHGLSPDRKIYQRFAIENGALVITVSNRGIRLLDKKVPSEEPEGGRRGWGLKLMRGLMDDVKIEDTDDGTRVTLTKHLASSPKP